MRGPGSGVKVLDAVLPLQIPQRVVLEGQVLIAMKCVGSDNAIKVIQVEGLVVATHCIRNRNEVPAEVSSKGGVYDLRHPRLPTVEAGLDLVQPAGYPVVDVGDIKPVPVE